MFIWFQHGQVEPYTPNIKHNVINKVLPLYPGIPDKSISIDDKNNILNQKIIKNSSHKKNSYEQNNLEISEDQTKPVFAKDIMSRNLLVVHSTDKISDVESLFKNNNYRHVPVLDKSENLIGIISEGDIYRYLLSEYSVNKKPADISISKLMKNRILTGYPDTAIREVVKIMFEHRLGSIPIVAHDTFKLLGIITRSDILKSVMIHTSMNLYS
jgi:CBS domain-containing protein